MSRELSQQTQDIWAMKNDGYSYKEIMDALNVSHNTVVGAVARGRYRGAIPPQKKHQPYDMRRNTMIRRGSIDEMLRNMTHEQHVWLVEEARRLQCGSLAEMVVEFVRDAYEEAQANE